MTLSLKTGPEGKTYWNTHHVSDPMKLQTCTKFEMKTTDKYRLYTSSLKGKHPSRLY